MLDVFSWCMHKAEAGIGLDSSYIAQFLCALLDTRNLRTSPGQVRPVVSESPALGN